MSYIDSDYVDSMLGAPLKEAYFTPQGGAYDATGFALAIASAKGDIVAAMRDAGYVEPTDAELTAMLSGTDAQINDAVQIQSATYRVFLHYADMRQDRQIESIHRESIALLQEIRKGQIKFQTLTVEQQNAIGGVTAPTVITTSSSSATNKKPVFGRGMGR